jgi:four helix bundle protein
MKGKPVKKEIGETNAEHSTFNTQRSTSAESDSPKRIFDLEDRLLEYAARIIRLVDSLPNSKSANHVGNQLLRSGTSPLPNHGEAQAAESREDFIHKFKIELRESRRWLRLIKLARLISKPHKLDLLIGETEELIRIFDQSIRTAKGTAEKKSVVAEDPAALDLETLEVERWTLEVHPHQPRAAPVESRAPAEPTVDTTPPATSPKRRRV